MMSLLYDGGMLDTIAGFDIGGTKVSLVIADLEGRLIYRSVEPTDVSSASIEVTPEEAVYHGLAEQLVCMLQGAQQHAGKGRTRAIGIVSAGPIRHNGLWNPPNIVPARLSTSPLERSMPLVEPLHHAFGCPVELTNDCNGAVVGEVYFGIGKDIADKSMLHIAYATISTGFGVGAWDGGHLIQGKDGNAGELGHSPVVLDGLLCGCGNRGCVEAYCSGAGIKANAVHRLMALAAHDREQSILYCRIVEDTAHVDSSEGSGDVLSAIQPVHVFDAATQGDVLASAVIDDLVIAGGVAFSVIANAYDPQSISVGGSIALAHPHLLGRMRAEMLKHLNVSPPELRLTALGSGVTEHGALAIARELLQKETENTE